MGIRRVLLLAIAVFVGPGLAAAQPDMEPGTPPLIIRGSSSAPDAPVPESGGSGVVLRGTPPAVAPPAPIFACAPGYLPDPNLGCLPPGTGYAPSDLDYWPYPWFDDPFTGGRRHRFPRHFARRGFLPRVAHHEFRRR